MRTTVPELLTSSYGRWRPNKGVLVRTSLGRPRWYPNEGLDLPVLRDLMPEGRMLGRDDWSAHYEAMLERRGPELISNLLMTLADENDADTLVLACFEASPGDCHRGVFARWWLQTTGQVVPDLAEIAQ